MGSTTTNETGTIILIKRHHLRRQTNKQTNKQRIHFTLLIQHILLLQLDTLQMIQPIARPPPKSAPVAQGWAATGNKQGKRETNERTNERS
jgi:hypothetical protein